MKKARTVEIDPEAVISYADFVKLSEHAFNSVVWYATNTPKSSGQIRDKLRDKGYPDQPVRHIDWNDEVHEISFIDVALDHAVESGILDDRHRVRSFTATKVNNGVALGRVRSLLLFKKFPEDVVDEVLAEFEDTDDIEDGIRRAAERVARTSAFAKLDYYGKKTKLSRALMSKGFRWDDISSVIDEFCEQ